MVISQEYSIDLPLVYDGKVRSVYDLGENYLIVASDRISAFDYVIPTLIPNKGKVLHRLSMFWFNFVHDIIPNHVVTGDFDKFPKKLKRYGFLCDRSMIVKKAERINIECIVRGYLSGSAWKEYLNFRTVCGIKLPAGFKESAKLPESIFAPSTKEEVGIHDKNISFDEMVEKVGKNVAEKLRSISIKLYEKVWKYSISKGIILADTKLEFGFCEDQLILIDEIFTPDSSRFWEVDKYGEGKSQDGLDKQYVRNYLEQIEWDKSSPAPKLPRDVTEKIADKYVAVYEKLTGGIF
jgi:phosphoribosylaminoimidazole-succinocarboxamide synthase